MSNKVSIKTSDYEKLIVVAKKVDENADDISLREQNKKFLSRGHIPTPEELELHHVKENFMFYLPYLVYYREPGIYTGPHDNAELTRTRKYLTHLFNECLDIVEDEEDIVNV